MIRRFADEKTLRQFAAEFVKNLKAGDHVLLEGPLGVGKTTFVRGMLEALNYHGLVRSPTYNLLQAFDTSPPVLHADLYRLEGASGLGLEDYLSTHIVCVEWPDRLKGLIEAEQAYTVRISFSDPGRTIEITEPLSNLPRA